MSTEPHIADAESKFFVLNVTPDFCKVGKNVVAFDPMQTLDLEEAGYSSTVTARSKNVLLTKSVIDGVQGNAGKGLQSGVSLGDGNVQITTGSATVLIQNRMTARDGDLCLMNVKRS